MTEADLSQLRREIRGLEDQRDELVREVERLGADPNADGEPTPWLAWDEIEAVLSELLDYDDRPTGDSSRRPAGVPSRAPADRAVVLDESRRRLSAIRAAVRERDRKLQELRRQKDGLLSLVAHDLRTPLVAIQGFAQLLEASGNQAALTHKQRQYVEYILQAVRAMNSLVDDLLTARSLEEGRLPLRPRRVGLERFLDQTLNLHREPARQKDIAVRVERPEILPDMVFDPDRIGQALGNLVQNAVKFTPQGGAVIIRLAQEKFMIRFEVLDQGPGIDEALLPGIFDRFTQGPVSETSGRGYGLGLYICKEIAGIHGGRVGAENQPEGGSCFWMEIPLQGGETGDSRGPQKREDRGQDE